MSAQTKRAINGGLLLGAALALLVVANRHLSARPTKGL
jgi:hypothetical protein